jgi:hypothetical protein
VREPCFSCGRPRCDGHHPTGKGRDGRYLDPYLTFAQCHDCHELTHDDWRSLKIEDAGDTSNIFTRLAIAMHRLAAFFGRVLELHPYLTGLARRLSDWAEELDVVIARLDRELPTWRKVADNTST